MAQKINPAWISYNNLHNEGGEGFNPHPKYLVSTPAKAVSAKPAQAAASTANADDLIKDERGQWVRRSVLVARLADYEKRLPGITDKFAREIVQKSIDFARAALA